jgi:Pentapeptide repeats (9 copies)
MSTQEPNEEGDLNSFICDCEEDMRLACASKGFYKKKDGRRYCVLHYPSDEKVAAFRTALNNKLAAKDYNFNGVWFPKGVSFKELHLDGTANFSSAIFNEYIDFSSVEFKIKALFNNAKFNAGVDFKKVHFSAGADFSRARFEKDVCFNEAILHRSADFRSASFSAVADFSSANFIADAHFFSASFGADVDFGNSSFSGAAYFSDTSFSGDANFTKATFSAVANFSNSTFSADANFYMATFSGFADFSSATFSGTAGFFAAGFRTHAVFSKASFSADAHFFSASFGADVDFRNAIFDAVANYYGVTFKDHVYFAGSSEIRALGDHPQLNLQFVHFEKPDRVSLHTLNLQPHWFVNVDSRKFEFTDVEFNYDLKDELERLIKAKVGAPHRLLSITCRQLADNAETNHRYHEASRLRYSSFDARRLERFYGLSFWRLDWWYWAASGYGERVLRAFIIFVVLISLCAIGYKKADFNLTSKIAITGQIPSTASSSLGIPDTQPRRLGWRESVLYSFNVSILQKPDPKPIGLWGNALVSLETVLGPAQAALLALALRRRFMR